MAAPITHIVLAEKLFDEHFSSFNKKDFVLGTLFPDIRYLGSIDRNKTHFNALKLNDIVSDNSFLAGAKFHSIVDEARTTYLNGLDIYSSLPKSRFIHSALKFLEDELLYDRIKNPIELSTIFSKIPYDQIGFPVARVDIDRWYSLLHDYCSNRPSNAIVRKLLQEIGFREEETREITDLSQQIRERTKYPKIVLDFYHAFVLYQ